jgi:hypothetical protein
MPTWLKGISQISVKMEILEFFYNGKKPKDSIVTFEFKGPVDPKTLLRKFKNMQQMVPLHLQ